VETQTPILQEHQAPEPTTSTTETYDPTPEDKKTIKMVYKLFAIDKKNRQKYDSRWLDYYRMFRGKQWKEARPSYRHSEVINMVFQSIQGSVPLLTDTRPKFDFLPEEPADRELAEIINQLAESDWQKYNWLYQITESIYDGHFYGTGLADCILDPKKSFGAGDIDISSVDPFYFFPGPKARDVNKKNRRVTYAEPVSLEELKREYPQHKNYFKADLIDVLQGERQNLSQVRYKSPVDQKTLVDGDSGFDNDSNDDALKITMYLEDDDFEENEKKSQDPDTGLEKVEYEQKLKYPKGRKIVLAGGVLCEDGPNPYEDGKFPYARFVNYIDPREFWGISEVEQLESPQKIFNKLISFALDVLTLMGNPIWVVDSSAGIDTDNLFNRPGLIVEKEPGSEVRREEGVQLQPYVMQFIDRMKTWFDDISGNTDVSRGATPGDVTAASAISALQEAGKTRIRQKSRNIDNFLQDLGQLYLSRVMQFRTAPQVVRVTNNQNASKYFKFHVTPVTDELGNPMIDEKGDPKRKAVVQTYVENEQGQSLPGEIKEYEIHGTFDVRVSTGSSLPFAKAERAGLAFKLFEAGAIDEPELLKAVELPNWESVWERVQARREQQAMQEAQAAAQGAPPQGPPPAA
jgi:hypothetical protein